MRDIDALDYMLENDMFEKGVRRIGAEQEMCLIGYDLRPAMKNMELLAALNDPCFTTELAKFNLELNLPPLPGTRDSLGLMENELIRRSTEVNREAHKLNAKLLLTGILPTISHHDMVLENMTPDPRYRLLNDLMYGTKGLEFEMHIRGIDELNVHSNTVLFESCNTSFQVHLQIDADKVDEEYNWAQAIAGPILASCTNSPIFFGKRLWRETRIALFHQSTDIRRNQGPYREERARVDIGTDWLRGGALELYRDNITRHRSLLTPRIEEDSKAMVLKGEAPELKALSLHNGTVYNWNRLCYGITDGKPHLRIECRYIPSGPTIVDEVANAAFWLGCMLGRPPEMDKVHELMDHDDARLNFFRSAREGLRAVIKWKDGQEISSIELIQSELIPMAKKGLTGAGFDQKDIDKYLGIIEERVGSGRTGSQWILDSFALMKKKVSSDEALVAITEGIYQRQKAGNPVHEWELPTAKEGSSWKVGAQFVEQVMSKDLITVQEDEPLELIKNIMLWSNVHHVPVENSTGDLVGMVSADLLLKNIFDTKNPLTAKEVMDTDPITVSPGTKTVDVLRLMIDRECRCVPVVLNRKVLGVFTENDRARLAEKAFSELDEG